jgi:hypothetical protein|eukprot:COSAG06_NODE_5178_length_3657_cov_3.391231_4_plen_39_part_00
MRKKGKKLSILLHGGWARVNFHESSFFFPFFPFFFPFF